MHNLAKEEKQALRDLEDAAKKGDTKAFGEAAKKAVAAQKDLIPNARELAEREEDPIKKKMVEQALTTFTFLLLQVFY